MQGKSENCTGCRKATDETSFVQCDACDDWWHLSCAGVGESVSERAWICTTCSAVNSLAGDAKDPGRSSTPNPPPGNISEALGASEVSRKLALLHQRRDAERKRLALELEIKFLKEEEKLLDEAVRTMDGSPEVERAETGATVHAVRMDSSEPEKQVRKPCGIPAASASSDIEQKDAGSSQASDIAQRATGGERRHCGAIAVELPSFSGDPAEWPLFFSHYRHTTEMLGLTNWENMLRLQKCLKGPALEAVRSRLILPDVVPDVIETLRLRFGRADQLIEVLSERIRRMPAPKTEKLESLIEFGMAVQALADHIVAANERAHLNNPTLIKELVGKLPKDQALQWARYIRNEKMVDLATFGTYMSELVKDATSLVSVVSESLWKADKVRTTRGHVNAHSLRSPSEQPGEPSGTACEVCSKEGHAPSDCDQFNRLTVNERWQKARALLLCFQCLRKHRRRNCRTSPRCGIDGCTFRHHHLLHAAQQPRPSTSAASYHHSDGTGRLFRIVPVTLQGPKASINTFAFLDEGSSLTLMDHDLAEQLGASGKNEPLCISWTGDGKRTESRSMRVELNIGPVGSSRTYGVRDIRTVTHLNLPSQSFQAEKEAEKFPHLRRLPLDSYSHAQPRILIGLDNLKLAVPLKMREGPGEGPTAVKTRLGWCVYGGGSPSPTHHSFHICECAATDRELVETIQGFYGMEQAGVGKPCLRSPEDQRALDLLETTTERVGDRFQTGLLWRKDDVRLPDSFEMALRRLECLERRMNKDRSLKEKVHQQLLEFEEKGYVHKATKEELELAVPGRSWYLPLGVVTNPKKPEKVRVIWDAAAKVDGISLNHMLLKGPDQLVSLIGVLFRFRLFEFAVCADVREMFLQIRMRPEDRQAQRFLWRTDPRKTPEVYIVDVVTFGSTCSPASAQFVKNRNATEHLEQHPRAVAGILESTYVDDYLDSFGTKDEALRVAREVSEVFRDGGFELHHWISNSTDVIASFETATDRPYIHLLESEKTERVLGMIWNPANDELTFNTNANPDVRRLYEGEDTSTKRQVVRCVMSLFDPLGLLSTFIIHGKILIQDIWRVKTGWDEDIGELQLVDWRKWVRMFPFIAELHIPRCYFPRANSETYDNCELHVFVDASPYAYACAVYLRIVDADGNPQCVLVAGKAKVTPLKPVTIPKLELQACILGVRLMKFVLDHHPIPIQRQTLWTDSTVALAWIRADPRNYRPYVAHRVVEILEHSSCDDWRWVPSLMNPADEATKWGRGPFFNDDSMWFHAHPFVLLPRTEWPKSPAIAENPADQIRATVLVHAEWTPIMDFTHFSRWEYVIRSMAYVKRFLHNARPGRLRHDGAFSQDELKEAEIEVLKLVQKEAFPEEVATLQTETPVIEKTSHIMMYTPMMDDHGLLRQNSRLSAADYLEYNVRFPVILPKRHHCTKLLVEKLHRRYRHAHAETVVNEIRQEYVIAGLRSLVKQISRDCVFCKIRRTDPAIPRMAPLPRARLAVFEAPFSRIGVDYFGPFLLKQGRSNVKRWVALFTCLTTRAVHLEVAYDMSTHSFIMCLRRFICRRGSPTEIYSDNGTNFHGAERLLRAQIAQGLSETFTDVATKWTFIPPGAPHMGGAWERLVRSVKAAIGDAYTEGKLNYDEFETMLTEAESIVNSHPLTYLPLDAAESEALTPNHFLLGNSGGRRTLAVTPATSSKTPKELYISIRRHLDRMWQRWLKEYLPELRKQTKWFAETRPLREGDVVIIADENKRKNWTRGRVQETLPASDGRVRQVLVKTASGIMRRPVSRLVVLDVAR